MSAATSPQLDGALDTILAQGVLGSFCVLLMFALYYAIRGWLREKDARLSDQKDMAKALTDLNIVLRDLVVESNKGASNLVVDAARSADAVKNALYGQEKALDDLRAGIGSLQQEQVRLALTLQTLGHPKR